MKNMKFTIHGFQQQKLLGLKLSNDDALILKVIKDMYSSASIEFIIHKNDKFMWVNYTALLNYIPIIGSKSNLMSKIKKFGDIGLIERVLKKERNKKSGNFAYIKPTIELDKLTEYNNDLVQNLDKGYPKFRQGVIQNLDNKDNINKQDNISNNNQSINQEKDKIDKIDYKNIICENINYDILKNDYKDSPVIDNILNIILDIVESKKDYIKVSGEDKQVDVVKSIFLKLNESHIRYFIENFDKAKNIKHIKNYIITSLYNSYSTIDLDYRNKVNNIYNQ